MRYNINLSPELNEKVSRLAHEFGVSKSSFISIAVGEKVKNYEKMDKIFDGLEQLINDKFSSVCSTHENNAHISHLEAHDEDFNVNVGTY